jgi:hypothetical protein
MNTVAPEFAPRGTQKKSSQEMPPSRVLELQEKIRDKAYLEGAIARIAFVMSKQLVEGVPIGKIL